MAEALSVWCQGELACVRARRRTQRSASYRNGTGRLGQWRKSWEKNWRKNWMEYFSRRLDDPRARIRTWDAGSRRWQDAGYRRRWDAGSRQRWDAGSHQRWRRWILQGVHLRRQHGELTGYSFQIRLLHDGALREQLQHGCVLLLRRLKVPQSRPDNRIRHQHRRRGWRRRCGDAIEIRRGEAAEVRHGEPIDARQRELIEIRQREAAETRQGIGGGGANDG